MQTPQESFAEFPHSTMHYARIRVTIEDPDRPHSATSALLIDRNWLDDFKYEHLARMRLNQAGSRAPEHELRHLVTELHRAEQRARDTRDLIALQVTRSLSDFYAKETTK